jgi:hypothetical protein
MSSLALLAANGQPSPVFVQPLIFLAYRADLLFHSLSSEQEAPKSSSRHAQQPEEWGQGHYFGRHLRGRRGIKDDRIQLKVADQVKIEISKSAIVSKQSEE